MLKPWADILKAAGWPTDCVVLDFETYYKTSVYTLKGSPIVLYLDDPRYEALGLAYLRQRPDGVQAVPEFCRDIDTLLTWLQRQYGPNLEGCTVVAHNAAFDGMILAMKYGIVVPHVVDTLGLARHIDPRQRNDLATMCKRYEIPDKGDTSQFSGLHQDPVRRREPGKMPVLESGMTPEQRAALASYARNDVARGWDLFKLLLPTLSNPTTELRLMAHTLKMFWEPTIGIDAGAGVILAGKMDAKADELVEATGETRKTISGNISFEAALRDILGEDTPMKQGKKGPILALAKADPERKLMLEHPNEKVRRLVEARIGIKSWPLHSKRVRGLMAQADTCNGKLPIGLKYCGAHTGRWSGSEYINPQNMGARSIEPLINAVRGLLVAPPGHVLVVTDAAQIEARGTGWVAGQQDLLDDFERGAAVYCQFAGEVLGRPIRKARKDDPPPIKKYLTEKRGMGKTGVLGCGYGMGAERCLEYARDVYHLDITAAMAESIVRHYRAKYDKIVKFWHDLEAAFTFVTRYPTERKQLAQGLELFNIGNCTVIQLPSGRWLRYAGVRIRQGDRNRESLEMPHTGKPGTRIRMWGGLLTENVVQALSRDIMGEAVLYCEDRGVPVAHHVHDEIISVVPEAQGEHALAVQMEALCARPQWAPDCPLAAEGQIVKKYGK